ncbi:hypothetical protein Nepgr_026646 [Nepenthes gracilis]|uniref:Secreted protein n=1 Tax=Nepenthes gracilis TaxID=150966 RepID=A0AAD3T8H1_NEPGR|nr:hypothetical protein Nepgr_026646 [Nepenthes gracilis]
MPAGVCGQGAGRCSANLVLLLCLLAATMLKILKALEVLAFGFDANCWNGVLVLSEERSLFLDTRPMTVCNRPLCGVKRNPAKAAPRRRGDFKPSRTTIITVHKPRDPTKETNACSQSARTHPIERQQSVRNSNQTPPSKQVESSPTTSCTKSIPAHHVQPPQGNRINKWGNITAGTPTAETSRHFFFQSHHEQEPPRAQPTGPKGPAAS